MVAVVEVEVPALVLILFAVAAVALVVEQLAVRRFHRDLPLRY